MIVIPLDVETYSKQKGSDNNGRRRRHVLRVATMSHPLERHTAFLVKASLVVLWQKFEVVNWRWVGAVEPPVN